MSAEPIRQGIFVCYRRSDTGAYAGRLNDALCNEFGENVFFDLGGAIDGGDDWKKIIDERLESCAALIVLIGTNWQPARLANPEDIVRHEISSALAHNVRVIPVLVNGGTLPSAADLPDEMRYLLSRQMTELTDRHWRADYEQLAKSIRKEIAQRQKKKSALFTRGAVAALVVLLGLVLFMTVKNRRTNEAPTMTDRSSSAAAPPVPLGKSDDLSTAVVRDGTTEATTDATTDAQQRREEDSTNLGTGSTPVPNQYYRLQLRHTKHFIDAAYCTDELNLQAGSVYDNGSCELFRFVPDDGGWSRLQLMATAKYLDACAAEVRLDAGQPGDASCQLWRLVPAGDGWSRLQLKRDGQYLEAEGCSTKIALGPVSDLQGGACQLWRIVAPPTDVR